MKKNYRICLLILMLFNTAHAQISSRISMRAWQLHHLDMDYCKKVMDHAADYNVNTIVLSHDIIGATMQLYNESKEGHDPERGNKIRELAQYAKSKNLNSWIWTHELMDVPEKFLVDDVVQMDKSGFWDWLESRYNKVLTDFPEFDGFMITFHETQYKIFDNQEVNSRLSMPERFQMLINTIYKACERHDKELIVRTFVYEPEQLQWLKEGLKKVNNNVIVQSKCVPHDWQPFYPHNPVIGAFKGKRQIIEYDPSCEYTGRNEIPYTSPEYFSYRWKYAYQFPEVIGYNARLDHGGYDALFTPNEINLYTLYRVAEDPEISPEEIWIEWATKRYGEVAAKGVVDVLKPTFGIVNRLFFPKGVWFTNHSRLPSYNYAHSHINFINKWNPEKYKKITADLHNPDIKIYNSLLSEKDTAIYMTLQSKWKISELSKDLSPNDYNDLNERLLLLLQTGLIWKSHAEAFFGYKLLDKNPELKPQLLRAVTSLKYLGEEIPDSQANKQVADKKNILRVAEELENLIKAK